MSVAAGTSSLSSLPTAHCLLPTTPPTTPPLPTTDAALLAIVQGTAATTGQAFFRALVKHLACTLRLRLAMVGEVVPERRGRVRTLAIWHDGKYSDDFEYNPVGTPCETVVGKAISCFPAGVQELFPSVRLLTDLRIESYLGVPLFDSHGEALGVLVVMHDEPLDDPADAAGDSPAARRLTQARALLTIFAARAAAELERQRADAALLAMQRDVQALLARRVAERTADLEEANAALRHEIDARRRAEEELGSVVAHARCILWRAEIVGLPGWEMYAPGSPTCFEWEVHVQNEQAAQDVLPLDVPEGSNYQLAWTQSLHPEDCDLLWQRSSMAMVSGQFGYQQEFRCRDNQGQWRWLSQDVRLATLVPGRWRAFGVCTDITDRKRAEQHSRFQAAILAQINDGVTATGLDARIIYWNQAAERIYGIKAADALGKTHDEILTYRILGDVGAQEIGRAVIAGQVWRGDVINFLHGAEINLEVLISCLRDEAGNPSGTLSIVRDVSTRAQAQAALQESQERFESFMRYLPAIAYIKDEEGRYVFMSEAAERQTGRPADQWIGKTDLELWPDPAGAALRNDDLAVLKAGQPLKILRVTPCPDGAERHWVAYKFPIQASSGRRFLAGISMDVTDRERSAAALLRSERHFKEAAESNRLLLLELDHRVRNNLAGLLGLLDVMRQRTADVNVLADALEGRLRAMAHVQDLLARTKYQAVALRTLAGSLLDAMSRMAVHSTRLTIDGPAVLISPRQTLPLTMILMEWFTNSCKYGAHSCPGGELRILWELRDARIRLTWQEIGGPVVAAPSRTSLGTDLIRGFATIDLHGECALSYPATGASHRLEFAVE